MNTLSWMIYAAEVVGRLGPFLTIGGGIAFLVGLFLFGPASDKLLPYSVAAKTAKIGFVALVLGLFIPSQNTLFMVAASEAGEQVIKTPEARELFEALRLRIMEELKVEVK